MVLNTVTPILFALHLEEIVQSKETKDFNRQ